jgi:HK97 family phage portal protein
MSLIGRLKTPKEIFNDIPMSNPKAWNSALWNIFGAAGGENVTEQSALTYSAWWNLVYLISRTVASLPLHLMQETDGTKNKLTKDPLYRVMYSKPNPLMTSMRLRETMTAHVLTYGNAYAEKVKDGYGFVRALWPITPNRVTPVWTGADIAYQIDLGTEKKTLSREKILHLRGLGFDGLVGYNMTQLAKRSIGLGMAMETFGISYFENGTHPGLVVSHPGVLKDSSKVRQALAETYSGLGQAHRLMLLEENMKPEKMGYNPEESQFLGSRQHQVPEIARWGNLPPHKLKDLTKSSFSNIEQEQISFVQDTILLLLVNIEQEYNTQLLTEREHFDQGKYFKHNVDGLLRGDSASRAVLYRALFNIGGITLNQISDKEDLPRSDSPYADERFVPLNMVPLSLMREVITKQLEKAAKGGNTAPADPSKGGQ